MGKALFVCGAASRLRPASGRDPSTSNLLRIREANPALRMTMGSDSDLTTVWAEFFLEGSNVDQ
jgi:hypothetical protein